MSAQFQRGKMTVEGIGTDRGEQGRGSPHRLFRLRSKLEVPVLEYLVRMEKETTITILGMPGAGKSTVGRLVADRLGSVFLDGDLLIREGEGRSHGEILREIGREAFLDLECRYVLGIGGKACVYSPGGSVVYRWAAIEHLRRLGPVVVLRLGLEELTGRIGDLRARGVVLREGQTLTDLYEERMPLYERAATVFVDASGGSAEVVADRLLAAIGC